MIFVHYYISVAQDVYFNSTSLLKLDLLRDPIAALRETIKFRFKTASANGVLLYSRGTQGDYIALQLRDNRMLLNIDLGKFIYLRLEHVTSSKLYNNEMCYSWLILSVSGLAWV